MVLGSPPRSTLVAFAETLRPLTGDGSQGSAFGARAVEPAVPSEPAEKQERPHPVSIAALVEREYDGRGLRIGRSLGDFGAYTRHYVTYRSEGLRISGILNVPAGKGPFPALVLSHGYIDPAEYVNGQGLAREQDYLARRGYLVLHTDYRNHAGSGSDPGNDLRLRLGYTVDVVNAVQALRRSSLPVDGDRIGLLGRSMGGGVTYNALVARPGLVDAAVVYAPVSSLAAQNFERWIRDDPEDDGLSARILERYDSPERNPRFWRDVSPRPFFDRITEPVLIHHGTADSTCPPAWSQATLRAMRDADVRARLIAYPGEEHAFISQWEESMRRTTDFLRTHLRG
jgi:dipeptidyl aminopeptidase/acylaminoacyl peptidase